MGNTGGLSPFFIKILNVESLTKSLTVKSKAIKIAGAMFNGPCELLSLVPFCSLCCFSNNTCVILVQFFLKLVTEKQVHQIK